MPGLLEHFRLTLRLNLRSKQALVYGYLVPIFFLLAFGSLFRSGIPPLTREMGQLLTISVLGGACFGLPTAIVADRERGVWRRYRLLPVPIGGLLASTLAARFVIIASTAIMQIILARLMFGTPLPDHPLDLVVAFCFVAFSFMSMGLVIAALAENVPAVQALGQSIFLPMIMIGGVGVPLIALPGWAQKVAGFLPGRYAVEALQPCFNQPHGLSGAGFDLLALLVIGIAACIAGVKMFRWDSGRDLARNAMVWVTLALFAWIAVGVVAIVSGRLETIAANPAEPMDAITSAQIDSITYLGLPDDGDTVTPLAKTTAGLAGDDKARIESLKKNLENWQPAHTGPAGQQVRNLVCIASIADVAQDPLEGRIARLVFDHLQDNYESEQLKQALAWIILHPNDGAIVTTAPELGFSDHVTPDVIRDRDVLYAKKFLGRLTGKVAD